MPTVKEIQLSQKDDLQNAKDQLSQLVDLSKANDIWDVGEDVSLTTPHGKAKAPVANVFDSNHMWHAIAVSLVGYDYAKEHEFGPDWDEEPLFINSGVVDGVVKYVRFPQGAADELDELETARGGLVLGYHALATQSPHTIKTYTIGFDAEESDMLALVNAVGLDAGSFASSGIQLLPAGQHTATTMTHIFDKKVKKLFDKTKVSNEMFIVDEHTIWGRNVDGVEWTGFKWKLYCRPNKDLWYLALWRIDLFGYTLDLNWRILEGPEPAAKHD